MKIKTVYKMWLNIIASLICLYLGYSEWVDNNTDTAIAWIVAVGAYAGASLGYYKLKQVEKK